MIAAPSGAGKTSLVRALMQRDPSLVFSISCTTRKQRPNEVHSEDYFFVDTAEFMRMVEAGEFLEFAKVFDNHYGTPRRPVEEALDAGRSLGDALASALDVDAQFDLEVFLARHALGGTLTEVRLPE